MHTGDTKQSISYLPATGKEMSLQSAAEEKRLRENSIDASVLFLLWTLAVVTPYADQTRLDVGTC